MSEGGRPNRLGIVGAGQMGSGIAQAAATSGFSVLLADRDGAIAAKAKDGIAARLGAQVSKGRLDPAARDAALGAIVAVGGIDALAEADLVVEAVPEDVDLKVATLKALDRVCAPGTILASNTSAISITRLAAATGRPERFAGLHFMHPVPVMKLVEGVRGLQTSDETFAALRRVAEGMGKVFIEARDLPGFCVNRILMPMINEAAFVLMEGVASAGDIDSAMTLGTNQPMGPLALADFIGLDTCLAILEVLHRGHGDPKFRPCPLLRQYVEAGWTGRKTGRGFHDYRASGPA